MNAPTLPPAHKTYMLGHSDPELRRLAKQATLINPITRRFLLEAGLAPGMRVLDVGTGVGDVALLAAEIVGPDGEVVGVDRSVAALTVARSRAERQAARHVSFREGDAALLAFDREFDAVIGRYVLLFQQSPGDVLRKLTRHVRPEGLIVFHEADWEGTRSSPPVPSYDRCARWIYDTVRLYGHEPHMGVRLHAAFEAAGLPAPTMQLAAVIGAGADSSEVVELLAELALTMLPEMERLGVVSAGEVAAETLVERIHRDVIAEDSVVVGRSEVGAWTRVPRQP